MVPHPSLRRDWFGVLTPKRIVITYVIFGLFLLFISDWIFPIVFADPATLRDLQAIKGALEVGISGGLIYVLVTRSQRDLRETNELLEGVLDASPLAIVAADREGRTTVWSNGAEEMYGWSEEEVLAEPAPNVPDEDWEDFEYLRDKMFQEEEPVIGYETTRQTKDGSRIDVSITTGPMRDETGDLIGIMTVQEDITEKKERERELDRLNRIVDQLPVGVFRSTVDGEFLDMNDEFVSLLDAESKEMLMEYDPREFYSDPDVREELFEKLQDEGVVVDQEIDITTVTGDQKWVSSTLRLIDVDGEQHLEGVSVDITERKRQEQELKKTKQRLQSIIDASPIGIISVDRNAEIELWSPGCEHIFGWSEENVLGEPLPTIHDEKQDEFDELWEQVVEQGEPVVGYETVRQTKDGTLIDVALTTALMRDADGDVIGVMGLFEDISERKEKERQLRREREQFERVLETSPVGITILNPEGIIERANDRAEEVLGLTSTEITSRQFDDTAWEIIDEAGDQIPAEELPFVRVRETGEPVYNFEHGIRRPSGEERWLSINASPLSFSDGGVERVVAVISDVTERRARKQELEESEARYRAIAETTPDAILTIDETGTIQFANSSVESIFGYPPDQLEGDPLTKLVPERLRERHRKALDRFLETDERQIDWTVVEFPGLRADGEEIELSLSFASYEEDGEQRITSIIRDVTERKRMERELQQNERRYRTLVEMSPDPIMVHIDGEIAYANDALADLLDATDPDALEGTPVSRYVDTDSHSDIGQIIQETQDGEREPTNRPYTVVTLDERTRHVETTSRPIAYEEKPAVLTIIKDVTNRYEHEQTLRTLHERTQAMVRAESREEILRIAVEATDELLGLDGTVVYEFGGGNELVPQAASEQVTAVVANLPTAVKGEGFLWDVFVDGDRRFFQDVQSGDTPPHDIPLHSAYALPLGNHGVLLTGTMTHHSLSATGREIAQLLTENLKAALDRAERETRLRERDRELEQQNERLEQLARLNQIIRKTTQAVIQSRTQDEVKKRVCEEFESAADYSFAWFGTRDEATGQLRLTQRAGMDPEYADHLGSEVVQSPLHSLVADALRNGDVQVARNILEDPDWDDYRRDALNQEYRSVAVVPIRQSERIESVLVIHGTVPELFDERECDVLWELGSTVGYALANLAEVDTVQSPGYTELEIRIGDEKLFLNRIATNLGSGIEFIGAIPGSDETLRSFLRFTDHPEQGLETELLSFETVSDVRPLSIEDGVGLYQVTITTPRFFRILQGNNARLETLTVEDGASTATIMLPGNTSVRSIVDEIEAVYPGTELQKRREDQNPIDTRETFRDNLLDQLTEKQLDALKTALYGGYYEWPRVSTSEELAATRDIAGSTFQHHLRAAERKLVSAVLNPA